MSRRSWIAGATIVVFVVAIGAVWLALRDGTYGATTEVTRGDIDVTIETVGTVELRDQQSLLAPLATIVDVVAVVPGDEVREGDVLLTLEREPFDDALQEAQNALVQAETNLSVAESDEDDATASGIAARVAAQQQVDEARQAVLQAEELRAQSIVLAPFDGTVIAIAADEGDPVGQNSELVQLSALEEFELILNIDEVDLPLLAPGAQAEIVLEAYPDRVISSEIHSIARRAEIVGGTTVFPARIRFQSQDGVLILPGMNAEVGITTEVREDVLLLPEGTFQTVGRRTFVDVIVDDDVERREIRTGVRSGGMVEIADGLNEGDEVVIP